MSSPKNRMSVDNIEMISNKRKKFLTPKKSPHFNRSFQLKKAKKLLSLNDAKILEIKGRKHLSSFHLVCENDKFKQIEKSIQNKILDISMKLIEDYKFDSELTETKQPPKTNKRKSSYFGSITPKMKKFSNNKLRKSSNMSQCSHNLSFFKQLINEK